MLRNGNGDDFSYDALNRKTCAGYRIVSADDSTARTVARQYDGLDDLTDEQSPQGEVSYTYDLAGRRQTMAIVAPAPNAQPKVSYNWDDAKPIVRCCAGRLVRPITGPASVRHHLRAAHHRPNRRLAS